MPAERNSLHSRLRALKSAKSSQKDKNSSLLPSHVKQQDTECFDGWEHVAPFVFQREIRRKYRQKRSSLQFIDNTSWEDLLFFDLETTGLGSGSGTIPFLAGLGRLETVSANTLDVEFVIQQVFLSDYPGEMDFVKYVAQTCENASCLVSYNGKAFDSHVLKTRAIMNGMRYSDPRHVDLLYISRSFWKASLPSCSLGDVEIGILGVQRDMDIPGSEVPERYFSFLKSHNIAELQEVFAHHQQDIASLYLLMNKIEDAMAEPLSFEPINKHALGKFLLGKDPERGLLVLQRAHQNGNNRAGQTLSLMHKKNRAYEKAEKIWIELFERGLRFFAGTELAKYYEHQQKEYEKALFYVDSLYALPWNQQKRNQLQHRRNRIIKKISQHRLSG